MPSSIIFAKVLKYNLIDKSTLNELFWMIHKAKIYSNVIECA